MSDETYTPGWPAQLARQLSGSRLDASPAKATCTQPESPGDFCMVGIPCTYELNCSFFFSILT